ncbi:MAG: cytochrome P450 [Burkholderiaceae bacterium]
MSDTIDYRRGRFEAMARTGFVPDQVSHGLNLILPLQDPRLMPVLMSAILENRPRTSAVLEALNFVHFARFLPTPDNSALQVITVFDGALDTYVDEFAVAIGDTFDLILSFVDPAIRPHLPVREKPGEFIEFVRRQNQAVVGSEVYRHWPLFAAYPRTTVLEITGGQPVNRRVDDDARGQWIDRQDVQGNVLVAHAARRAWHYALRLPDAQAGRRLLGAMLTPDAFGLPQVTHDLDASTRARPYYLNVGLTAAGLVRLGVSSEQLGAFPAAFLDGPRHPERCRRTGDVGSNDPRHWELSFDGGQHADPQDAVHLLLSLYGADDAALAGHRRAIEAACDALGIARIWCRDARALAGGIGHFGYRDGIAQPRIAGVDDPSRTQDHQPMAGVGDFLLGARYPNAYGAPSLGAMPFELAENGCFAAVRLLEQDVEGFEAALKQAAAEHGIHPELLAAKLMGRWRSGEPLSLTGHQADLSDAGPAREIGREQLNAFDYIATDRFDPAGAGDDIAGALCPVGSHIRRMNPRSAPAVGKAYSRRMIRRGMPYVWADAGDGQGGSHPAKGLLGIFICSDLERQYEFVLGQWANGDLSQAGMRGGRDPFAGAVMPANGAGPGDAEPTSPFRIAHADGRVSQVQIGQFVRNRGSVYLLLPGLTGLRWLAGMPAVRREPPPGLALMRSRPQELCFDVHDPDFHRDPYPYYALLRERAAVVRVPQHNAWWVLSAELVEKLGANAGDFLKKPLRESEGHWPHGLFHMDGAEHRQMRTLLDPIMAWVREQRLDQACHAAIDRALAALGDAHEFDLVRQFAHRVPLETFMAVFGARAEEVARFDALIQSILRNVDPGLPANRRSQALISGAMIEDHLIRQVQGGADFGEDTILGRMQRLYEQQQLAPSQFIMTAVHFMMGGYLSTRFLITTGIWNLLRHGVRSSPPSADPVDEHALAEMLRFDAPFQMADRYAARDLELGGVRISRDDKLVLVYGAANRDPARFADPDIFDIRRIDAGSHFAFGGQSNPHHCIGHHLAGRMAGLAMNRLFAHFPGLHLPPDNAAVAGPLSFMTDPYFRSPEALTLFTRV